MPRIYYAYSDYLKEKYGQKVYKLPVSVPVTCPNRDGTKGTGGCIYCSPEGAGFESLPDTESVESQLKKNREKIGRKYNAKLFIAYFQNFCNTYMDPQELYRMLKEAALADIVEIHVATRPDCVSLHTAEILKRVEQETGRKICVELGLQSINARTLDIILRKHSLAEFIDARLTLKDAGIAVAAHIIADLPWDTKGDVVECAKVLSALRLDGVKLHALYVPKGTVLSALYGEERVTLLNEDDYVDRVIALLCHLSPGMPVQRLIGRIPEELSVTANFNKSWWLVKERIEKNMEREGLYQGIHCTYLNGDALIKKGYEKIR